MTHARPDPRLIQAASLAVLLAVGLLWFGIDATPAQAAVSLGACLATEAATSRMRGRRFDWRSPAITGLSLTLLLRSQVAWAWALAGVLGVGSKALVRRRGKHVFNPACFGIVAMLGSGAAWVSPGQWGALGWSVAALAGAACLVLTRARRADLCLAFLASYAGLLALRCWSLGDPWSIPLHQIQSGSLLVFACFMITDPASTPGSRPGRLLFGAAVAALAHWMQFHGQLREGLFYALALASLATPLLDMALPAQPAPLPLEA